MKKVLFPLPALILVVALAVPILSTTPAMAAAPSYKSLATNVNSSNSATSLTITKPTGTAADDLLIAAVSHNDPSGAISGPSGWTEEDQGTSGSSGMSDIRLSVV